MLIALKQPSIAVDVDCIETACLLIWLLIARVVDCIEAVFYCFIFFYYIKAACLVLQLLIALKQPSIVLVVDCIEVA